MIHFKDYRAEGGKHIVVYNAINRTVLRIIKADRGEKVSLKSEKAEIEKRLKYERHVIVSTWLCVGVTLGSTYASSWQGQF